MQTEVAREATRIAFEGDVHKHLRWRGTPCCKHPCDLLIYQEIVDKTRPELIIECGTRNGGSALFLADMCELVGSGRVITVDNAVCERPCHERITYVLGSSTSDSVVELVTAEAAKANRILVILDSDHRTEHVLRELELYSPLVTKGSYIIVEDTILGGHPVRSDLGPGPTEAINEFMSETKDFEVDTDMERLMITYNAGGFLKRV